MTLLEKLQRTRAETTRLDTVLRTNALARVPEYTLSMTDKEFQEYLLWIEATRDEILERGKDDD